MAYDSTGARPLDPALVSDQAALRLAPPGFDPSRGDRLQRLLDADKACSAEVNGLFERHGSNRIHCTEDEWNEQTDVFAERDAARAELMPTEQDAIKLMSEAFTRLKDLGWREAIYCPKDGSEFDIVEAGSTGIHKAHYSGDWPDGSWWVADAGDLWPSRPTLYRPTEAELAKREALRAAFRASCDSDGNPKGGDGTAPSQSDDSAGRDGIAHKDTPHDQ